MKTVLARPTVTNVDSDVIELRSAHLHPAAQARLCCLLAHSWHTSVASTSLVESFLTVGFLVTTRIYLFSLDCAAVKGVRSGLNLKTSLIVLLTCSANQCP